MSKFKVGDKVVRLGARRDTSWQIGCARNNVTDDFIGTVDGVMDEEWSGRGSIKLKEFSSDRGPCDWWDATYFTYAPAPAASVDALASEVARCCGTVADKEEMQRLIAELKEQLAQANDQRDAAVLAAKTLGDEVQELRRERREYRVGVAGAKGHVSTLMAGIADIDLGTLSSQLDQIGRMADEQGNGADAKMCFDASQVLDMVERFLSSYDAE